MITMLDNHGAREVLQSARVARLGCIVNGEPYVVPINYHFEGDCLYSHSLQGMKINGLRENPRACVQVDEIDSDLNWRSAMAFGKFEEIKAQDERTEILTKLLRDFPMLTPVESAIAEDGSPMEIVVFRIKIDRITGVSEGSRYAGPIYLEALG
jgi:nitroimidazol reductase NimA-like FMN-containing flavoprotein (pyridoxamine 5'-phosphate oxidase superfamily)